MSASEKLKALDARWWKDHDEAHRMFNALPQIVAVVEALQEHQTAARARWTNLGYEGEPLTLREYHNAAAALTALDEALP